MRSATSGLIRFVEHRVGDRRVIRLIRKWLKAGVMEDGEVTQTETGTPQGGVASPLLANIYLHYVFDLWAARWRRHQARGNIVRVRYADDIVAGFEHQADAERFQADLRDRLAQFALTLHPDKTRLLQFRRRAGEERGGGGLGKPETFDFLGFTHICGRSRRGRFLLFRRTRGDRKRAKVREVKEALRRRMHDPIPSQGQWLRQVVTGFFFYYAGPKQLRRPGSVPVPHHGALDAYADAAQPEGPHRVGPDLQARGPVAAKATHPSPLAQPAVRRQTHT